MGQGGSTTSATAGETKGTQSIHRHHSVLGPRAAAGRRALLPEEILAVVEDGKRLVDCALFLSKHNKRDELLALWKLDAIRGIVRPSSGSLLPSALKPGSGEQQQVNEECVRLASFLSPTLHEYAAAEEHKQNFDSACNWPPHDSPEKRVEQMVRKHVGTSDGASAAKESAPADTPADAHDSNNNLVDRSHEMYSFAVAVMVGIHVAVSCNDQLMDTVGTALGGPAAALGAAKEAFESSFPNMHLAHTLSTSVRAFTIPHHGSKYSPKTIVNEDYVFEDFCPELFAQVREESGIANAELYESICRVDFQFIAFGTNSKSGEFFFFSHDRKFLLKTTSEEEAETLVQMLPDYVERLMEAPHSLLCRYLGLYRLKLAGKSRLFLVMRAVATNGLQIHRVYDLKGSTRHRMAPDTESVGKDMNFLSEIQQLRMSNKMANELCDTHAGDLALLRKYQIMDFSLLLMIHDTKGGEGIEMARYGMLPLGGGKSSISMMQQKEMDRVDEQAEKKRAEEEEETKMLSKMGAARSKEKPRPEIRAMGVKLVGTLTGKAMKTWFADSASFQGRKHGLWLLKDGSTKSTAPTIPTPGWTPGEGLKCGPKDALVCSFGIIDMLVPFYWFPKAQYWGEELITLGKGAESSRVPPIFYSDRQENFLREVVGLQPKDDLLAKPDWTCCTSSGRRSDWNPPPPVPAPSKPSSTPGGDLKTS